MLVAGFLKFKGKDNTILYLKKDQVTSIIEHENGIGVYTVGSKDPYKLTSEDFPVAQLRQALGDMGIVSEVLKD